MEWEFILPILQIIGIDLVLSGDNAVVIAMASHRLPPAQRRTAFLLGAGGAVVLRIIATIGISLLLQVPLLLFGGGLLLLWIALRLLMEEEEAHRHVGVPENLMHAIKTIMAADFIMSLDNMLAVAGAGRDHMALIIFGLLFSIAIIMTGSAIISDLMNRYPVLITIGAGILAWTAGHMIVGDQIVKDALSKHVGVHIHGSPLFYLVPAVVTVLVVTSTRWAGWIRRSRGTSLERDSENVIADSSDSATPAEISSDGTTE